MGLFGDNSVGGRRPYRRRRLRRHWLNEHVHALGLLVIAITFVVIYIYLHKDNCVFLDEKDCPSSQYTKDMKREVGNAVKLYSLREDPGTGRLEVTVEGRRYEIGSDDLRGPLGIGGLASVRGLLAETSRVVSAYSDRLHEYVEAHVARFERSHRNTNYAWIPLAAMAPKTADYVQRRSSAVSGRNGSGDARASSASDDTGGSLHLIVRWDDVVALRNSPRGEERATRLIELVRGGRVVRVLEVFLSRSETIDNATKDAADDTNKNDTNKDAADDTNKGAADDTNKGAPDDTNKDAASNATNGNVFLEDAPLRAGAEICRYMTSLGNPIRVAFWGGGRTDAGVAEGSKEPSTQGAGKTEAGAAEESKERSAKGAGKTEAGVAEEPKEPAAQAGGQASAGESEGSTGAAAPSDEGGESVNAGECCVFEPVGANNGTTRGGDSAFGSFRTAIQELVVENAGFFWTMGGLKWLEVVLLAGLGVLVRRLIDMSRQYGRVRLNRDDEGHVVWQPRETVRTLMYLVYAPVLALVIVWILTATDLLAADLTLLGETLFHALIPIAFLLGLFPDVGHGVLIRAGQAVFGLGDRGVDGPIGTGSGPDSPRAGGPSQKPLDQAEPPDRGPSQSFETLRLRVRGHLTRPFR